MKMDSLPSVMKHSFSKVPQANIPRSSFNRSHGLKTTFDAGYLVPIFVDEALPGDTFNCNAAAFGRLATPIHPVMDNMYIDTFFFAVPNRLLWDNWEKFNGAQDNPTDSTDYVMPTLDCPTIGYAEGSIFDYFGLPINVDIDAVGDGINALPLRAYNLIWNEWFRDQNLQDSVTVETGDAGDTYADYSLLKRGKRHDYFTSCLPWPQKGDAVDLPLGSVAPIVYGDSINGTSPSDNKFYVSEVYNSDSIHSYGSTLGVVTGGQSNASAANLFADLNDATAATINQLREAFQVQKLYERDARGGTRYTEIIRSHFGVTSPDYRMQRPEYLGGGSAPININPIAQTSSTDATTPQGNLAAMGTASFNGHGFTKSFTEHCVIIGLACVRADLTYQQGLNRMWSRSTRFDHYWPSLAHIGEQAVLNKEIMCQGTSADDDVFGYQERYAEYRYKPSYITGAFRSDAAQSLDAWHLSQDFATLPVLDDQFIQENPPVDRVIAVPSQPHLILDMYFKLHCARPMPTYSVPGMIDHF
jgi:hypothetical protein